MFDLACGSPATSLDLVDRGDRFVVVLDAPGYERNDLEISLSGTTLAIDGERDPEREAKPDAYLRRERRANAFSRRLDLPTPVDADAAEARLREGILRIALPKRTGRGARRRIEVE